MFNTLVNIHIKIKENGNLKNSKKNVAVINFIYLTVSHLAKGNDYRWTEMSNK